MVFFIAPMISIPEINFWKILGFRQWLNLVSWKTHMGCIRHWFGRWYPFHPFSLHSMLFSVPLVWDPLQFWGPQFMNTVDTMSCPPGQWPRKTWPFNFDDQDLLLLDGHILLIGPFGWRSVFNHQLRSVFRFVSVRILMALSCIRKSFLVINDISYMKALHAGNNPAGNDINFRILTSLHLP